jgi:hypothetical protein
LRFFGAARFLGVTRFFGLLARFLGAARFFVLLARFRRFAGVGDLRSLDLLPRRFVAAAGRIASSLGLYDI